MPDDRPLVIAVVPVHNRLAKTSRFLNATVTIDYPNLRFVVVDDGSTDGTGEWVRLHHPEVHLISADGGQWWAGSTNLGVAWALGQGADYILTINDDSTFDPDFVSHLVARADLAGHAVVGSRLMWADRPEFIWSLGTRCQWSDNRLWEQLGRDQRWDDLGPRLPHPLHVDTLCGNGTLIPAQVFASVGLYDAEHLPQYHADADLVLRARCAGWQVLVETASVIRNDSASSDTLRDFWWSLTNRGSPLFLPAMLTILGRWCPSERRGLLLLGQYAPILLPFLRRSCASSS